MVVRYCVLAVIVLLSTFQQILVLECAVQYTKNPVKHLRAWHATMTWEMLTSLKVLHVFWVFTLKHPFQELWPLLMYAFNAMDKWIKRNLVWSHWLQSHGINHHFFIFEGTYNAAYQVNVEHWCRVFVALIGLIVVYESLNSVVVNVSHKCSMKYSGC